MPHKLDIILGTLGLNRKEAVVYVASLELGKATGVQEIAQQCGLPRATVYGILDALAHQGLVSSFEKSGVKKFTAEDPEKIVQLARAKVQLLEDNLPRLRALYHTSSARPLVRFFQGKEGMKLVLEEALKDKKNISTISSADDLFATLDSYFSKFVQRRAALKISNRVILRDSAKARERKRLGPRELRQVRLISATHEFRGMKMIFGNKVAFFTFSKELMSVVMQSEEVARLEQAEFDLLWQSLSD